MLINVLNGSLKKVAILSNELPNAPSYYNDEFHDYLEQGATTFSFTVAKVINNQLQDYTQFLSDQSYFSFRKNGRDYLMTPSSEQSVHETSTEISFFCVSLDRELINEQANSLANTASHNIQWYFDRMGLISRTKITIGINEVSNLTRVINYDAQESKLSRLISVINNFNAEFDFVTTLNNDGSLGTVVLNIYKENDGQNIQGVGTKRDDVRLTFGKNIEDVEVDVSDDGFFNAAYMTGADGFSWKNYDFSYKNSDGVEEFYKRKGYEIAYAPLSAKMFPSQLKTDKGDIWTNSDRTTEYKNANDMWGYIVSQFKQYAYKQITYTVTPSSTLVNQLIGDGRPLQKGDTVIIQDDNYMDIDGNVGLILSARVSEIITSDTNPANNKIVFSNYKKLKSEASSDIKAIVSQLVNDATPYFADIATSNGVQFKNGTGSTTLSAHIFKGSATTETIADSYEWSKDGTVVANVQEITVDASGVANKAVYSFKATVAGKVVANQSVTITNVDDGTNGRSVTNVSQKWRLTTTTTTPTQAWSDAGWLTTQPTTTATNKYLWSITRTTFNLAPLTQDVIEQKAVYGDKGDKGDTGNDGRAGKDGVGINSTTITYSISTSGTTAPSSGYTSTVPTLVKGQYLWTKTVWTYTDNSSETGYSVTYIAKDGNNGNDGIAGKDGVGIKTTVITYASHTNGTTPPTTGYTTTVPSVPAGQFLWTKTVWTYTDNSSETGYSVAMMGVKGDKGDTGNDGRAGKDGVGINSTTITYSISTSGTTAPSSGYTSTVPTLVKGQYLWTKTVWTYTDNSSETGYSVTYIAKDGNNGNDGIAGKDGVGIKTTVITYASHTNGTTPPTTGYTTTVPSVPAGQFLWTKTVWTYTDNSSETGYSVAMMGVKGDKGDTGNDGRAGKDGVGINSTTVTYTISSSGTVTPTAGWTSQVPTLVKGQYLWTKTVWTYTDNSSETGYTVSYIAKDGNNGHDGIPGKDGTGIKKTTITYAVGTSGITAPASGWNSQVPNVSAGQYLWTKTVWDYTDNTSETGYSVSKFGETPYFHTAWSYSADGKDGFTTVYPNLNLLTDSKEFKNKNVSESTVSTSITSYQSTIVKEGNETYLHYLRTNSNYSDWFRAYLVRNNNPNFPNVDVKGNTHYTFSVWLRGTGTHTIYAFNGWTEPWNANKTITLTKEWNLYTFTVLTRSKKELNTKPFIQFFIRSDNVGSEINLKYPKVEPGSIATPYMPSESEVTTADWPRYIGQYTDFTQAASTNPSAYTWSLIRGNDGERGPAGNDGDPGKIVSETEPTTRFKGLTWKYLGMSDLTASDGTVILSGTEYYWSGTHWILNEINAHNINGDNLSVTNGTFTNGKIKSTWNSGTASGSTEIENSHINMSATNSSSKATNSLGLDIRQGFGMRWTDPASNQSRSVLLDYGNLAFDRNGVAAGLSFDGANLSSSMPIQAPNTIVKSTQFSVSGIGIRLDRMMSFVAVTFSGQASSAIKNSPTVYNVLPEGFRPISPYSIDYIVPGNTANSGYIYFNPDGSIRIMATINSGYYIRGTRFYITNDVYPS